MPALPSLRHDVKYAKMQIKGIQNHSLMNAENEVIFEKGKQASSRPKR